MKLNDKIVYYRRERRMSQEELAAQAGVSRQAVSKWELGEASPDIGKLLALAKAFGVTTDHLLNEEEEPKRSDPSPARESAPTCETPPPPAQPDPGSSLPGFIGKMVRRWGWLAGIYIALQGLGVTLVGALARWGFGSMFRASGQMMGGIGGLGMIDGYWIYDGDGLAEMEGAILDAMGAARQSPLSGVQGFFLGFATIILVIGLVMVIGGLILAFVLWNRGKKGD